MLELFVQFAESLFVVCFLIAVIIAMVFNACVNLLMRAIKSLILILVALVQEKTRKEKESVLPSKNAL